MNSELSVAVLHVNVGVSVKEFLKSVEEFVVNSKGKGAQLVVMPAPLHPLIDVLKGSKKFSTYESSTTDLLNKLLDLSNKVLMYFLISPIIYRAGSRKYLASTLITPQGKTHNVRKVFGESDLNIIISPGREVEVLDVCGIKLCPVIGSDINVPEVSRLCNYLGSDVILSIQLPGLKAVEDEILKSLLIARAVENSIPIVNLGSYMEDGVSLAPTLLVSSSGELVDIYSSFEPGVFVVDIVKRKVEANELVIKYLKNIIKFLVA
ncbi:MAG: carbon-nitrogen hydrolase family protein [Sulfolobales archaeon]